MASSPIITSPSFSLNTNEHSQKRQTLTTLRKTVIDHHPKNRIQKESALIIKELDLDCEIYIETQAQGIVNE